VTGAASGCNKPQRFHVHDVGDARETRGAVSSLTEHFIEAVWPASRGGRSAGASCARKIVLASAATARTRCTQF
jgi:hypothetical protein